MRLLLDTHIFLWAIGGSRSLKPSMRQMIQTADEVYVSAASIWEIAVKAGLGKIKADTEAVVDAIGKSGFTELPVRAAHAVAVTRLAKHHNDPFDRLLIAQAVTEPLKLLTVDALLGRYSDVVMVVG